MLLYLDLNCFNRPFDDQDQQRIALETAAVFSILQRLIEGLDQLAWSEALDFENAQHPLPDRRTEIGSWSRRARVRIRIDEQVAARTEWLHAAGLAPLDATHLACAEAGVCACLITCDDRFIRRARRTNTQVVVKNPVEYLEDLKHG
ncbi:MAG TPA: PIN domain-containing protein [Thermoanaerobaculia bacterium]